MAEIDPAYIQPIEHRPKPVVTEAQGIPIIDLTLVSSIHHFTSDSLKDNGIVDLVSAVREACAKWGFFQVTNHGVAPDTLDNLKLAAHKFFSLPEEEKGKVSRDEANPMGYYDSEHTKNVRDWKQVFDFTAKDPTVIPVSPDEPLPKQLINRWPQFPPDLSEYRPSPSITIETQEIPLIDISSALTNNCPSDKVLREIKEACEKWGFFQVIHHGVPQVKRHKVELAARQFFALPAEEKNKVKRDEENPLGYYDSEHTKNVRDWKQIFDFNVQQPTLVPASHDLADQEITQLWNQWPLYPSQFRVACEEYTQEMMKLSFKLLELVALSLGLAEDRLNGYFKDHASFVRFNYYPTCRFPHLALGVGPHKDSGALTVLAQDDIGGLEVKRKMDGEWILVKPIPDAYIINVGDVIQVWSNDRYESVEHRVKVNPEKERLSIPFFINPSHYVMVKPLDELIGKQEHPKYKEYNYGKFLARRRLSDFKKLNVENIQIRHFSTPTPTYE